jgi:hypothetical protein
VAEFHDAQEMAQLAAHRLDSGSPLPKRGFPMLVWNRGGSRPRQHSMALQSDGNAAFDFLRYVARDSSRDQSASAVLKLEQPRRRDGW